MSKPWAGLCRFGGIGDNFIASSVLPLLARTHNVEVITQSPQSVVFENNPHIAKLTVYPPGHIPGETGEKWQEWFNKIAIGFDRFYHLSHSIETLVAFVPGQTHYNWPASARRQWADKSYLQIAHDVCEVPHEYEPRFFPTDEETEKAQATKYEKMGAPLIGWVVSGSRFDKIYPYSAMAIVRLIREIEGCHVLLFGGNNRDSHLIDAIREHVERENSCRDRIYAAQNPPDADPPPWPLRRSLSQLQVCDLVIGPDTGLLWSVASRPMPKVLLLSHASQRNITAGWKNTTTLHADRQRVPCWPCHRLIDNPDTDCTKSSDKLGAACISDISVESILRAAKRALDNRHVLEPLALAEAAE